MIHKPNFSSSLTQYTIDLLMLTLSRTHTYFLLHSNFPEDVIFCVRIILFSSVHLVIFIIFYIL